MNFFERMLGDYLRRSFARQMRLDRSMAIRLPSKEQCQASVLYIHIPFCTSICPFCSFHRVLLSSARPAEYFEALRRELVAIADMGFRPSIIYVGGGTPTVLPEQLAETINLARVLFPVRQLSVETNPNQLTDRVLSILKSCGVNRLSVGIQSFDDDLLRQMARYDAYGSGEQNIRRLAHANGEFDTLNVDAIFNLPGQTPRSLQRDLDILIRELKIDQVSYYPLMASPRTAKNMQRSMGTYSLQNERRFYEQICRFMETDYSPASVWCFSRTPGMIDEYIIANTDYIGAGSGAFSYLDGTVYANTLSIKRYSELIGSKGTAITAQRKLDVYDRARYDMLMTLFGLSLSRSDFEQRYDGRFFRLLRKEFLVLRLLGATQNDGDYIRVTPRGRYLWLTMMREFFAAINNYRDQMRDAARAER